MASIARHNAGKKGTDRMERSMTRRSSRSVCIALFATLLVSGCDNLPPQFQPRSVDANADGPNLAGGTSLSFEERDIEAPEVFNVTDTAVWDGRPSFGGVWAAYPGNTQPERVVITNSKNGKSVVGALFKSEKENPGPKIKLSSDAASELGVVAGEPTELTIVAIRKQPVQLKTTPVSVEPVPEAAPVAEVAVAAAPAAIETTPIQTEVLTETLAAAIETAPKPRPAQADKPAINAPAPTPVVVDAPPSSVPEKPFIQVATLTSEANATTLEKKLADAGISSLIRVSKTSSGKDLYRVLAGPAVTQDALRTLSEDVAKLGFSDAFPVTN